MLTASSIKGNNCLRMHFVSVYRGIVRFLCHSTVLVSNVQAE